jgi:aryl-alcohol dehydrogenase-like predicted oxidoreductase
MEYTILGRTGLKASVMGLGCGGPSRLGKNNGHGDADAINIIRHALDAGVTVFDTAESYRTEQLVGKATKGWNRDDIVLSTKKSIWGKVTAKQVRRSLDKSLKHLDTRYIDVYSLHAVSTSNYERLARDVVPVLKQLRDDGKIRCIGITESFAHDPGHGMLQRALDDDCWDTMMVGFNMLNPSARDRVFKKASEKRIGIIVMHAVRKALSNPERLRANIQQLVKNGQVAPSEIDATDPLGFIAHENGARGITDAAYRFCCYEPRTHVILSGTGNVAHLDSNIESFSKPPLPAKDLDRLANLFGRVDSVSGD